jgi:2'-5' RNA ligase
MRKYSVWLATGADDTDTNGIVRQAMTAHYGEAKVDGLLFTPHVTVFSADGTPEDLEAVKQRLSEFAKKYKPLSACNGVVDYNSDPENVYQCVYVRFNEDPNFSGKWRAMRGLLAGLNEDPPFPPHLSITYGKLSVDDRIKNVENVGGKHSFKHTVKFTRLIMIDCTSTVNEGKLWDLWTFELDVVLEGNEEFSC